MLSDHGRVIRDCSIASTRAFKLRPRIMDIHSTSAAEGAVHSICEIWAKKNFRFGCRQYYYLYTTSCRQSQVVSLGNPLANKKFAHIRLNNLHFRKYRRDARKQNGDGQRWYSQ